MSELTNSVEEPLHTEEMATTFRLVLPNALNCFPSSLEMLVQTILTMAESVHGNAE